MNTSRTFPKIAAATLLTLAVLVNLEHSSRSCPPGLPQVSIWATDPNASEVGPDPGKFRIYRSGGDSSVPLVVYFVQPPGGTAQNGSDYQTLAEYVTIPANTIYADLTVSPILDADCSEGNETVILTLATNANYWLAWPTNATVTIGDAVAPRITTVLTNQAACAGADVMLRITATGTGPLTYAWKHDGVAILGQTNSSLTLDNVSSTDAGTYQVIVSGHCGSVSNAATLMVIVPPSITAQPQSRTNHVGTTASLGVTASGYPLSYQWRFNNTDINGATGNALVMTNVQTSNAGNYSVVISNACGSVTSSIAALVVTDCYIAVDAMLVVDRSGSMLDTMGGSRGSTRPRLLATIS